MLSFLGMRVNYTSLSTTRESQVVIVGRCGFRAAANQRGTGRNMGQQWYYGAAGKAGYRTTV